MSIERNYTDTPIPADLAPIAEALDLLAQHERDSARPGMESRVAAASRDAILGLREPVIVRFAPARRTARESVIYTQEADSEFLRLLV